MLKKIEIVKVVMEGFKFYKEKVEKNFTQSTIFVGGNGQGKSTIADAIAWAITGKIYEGKKQIENGILNIDSSKALVEVYFLDEFGQERVIKRTYTEASGVSTWLDKNKISQRELNKIIDVDKFLLNFNPFTFLTKKQQEARKLIIGMMNLSSVTDDIVLGSLKTDIQDTLKTVNIKNVNKELQSARKKLSLRENEIIVLNGYIRKNNEEITEEIEEKKELANIVAIKDLENKISEMIANKPNIDNYTEALSKKSELDSKIAMISGENFDNTKLLKLKNKQEQLKVKLKNTEDMVFTPQNLSLLEIEVTSLEKETSHILKENDNLRDKITKIRNDYKFKRGDNCPCCQQAITDVALKDIAKFVTKQTKDYMDTGISNKSKVEELEEKMKEIANKISLVKAEDSENEKLFNENKEIMINKIKEEIANNEELIKALELERDNFEDNKNEIIKPLLEEIELLNLSGIKKSIDEYEEVLKEEKALLKQLKEEDKTTQDFNKAIDNLIKNNKKLEKENRKYEKEIKVLEKEISAINILIEAIKEFNQTKIRMIEDLMKNNFNKVSLKIEDINPINGEIKPCFKVFYEDKIIEQCSLSEQMKAGMEIVEMLKETFDIDYPMFLDNSESITNVKTSVSQIIRTVVVDIKDVITVDDKVLEEININSKDIVLKSIV